MGYSRPKRGLAMTWQLSQTLHPIPCRHPSQRATTVWSLVSPTDVAVKWWGEGIDINVSSGISSGIGRPRQKNHPRAHRQRRIHLRFNGAAVFRPRRCPVCNSFNCGVQVGCLRAIQKQLEKKFNPRCKNTAHPPPDRYACLIARGLPRRREHLTARVPQRAGVFTC